MNRDEIDISTAEIASNDCPDVRGWRIGASMRRVEFTAGERFERGNVMVHFAGRDELPAANSTQGPISYTLWGGFLIGGRWRILPLVECIRSYVPTGDMFVANHVRENLLYYATAPLLNHNPATGERILLFCTTGDTRRQNAQAGPEWRTNTVVVRFQVGVWDWAEGGAEVGGGGQGGGGEVGSGGGGQTNPEVGTERLDRIDAALARLQTRLELNATLLDGMATKSDIAALRQEVIDVGRRIEDALRQSSEPAGAIAALLGLFGRRR